MGNSEWDTKINELRDELLVTQRLIELNERNWNRRFEKLTDVVTQLADSQRTTEASLTSLIAQIDRFVQGRAANGH
jgi:hypothetical protein